jgi:hypothetical protein
LCENTAAQMWSISLVAVLAFTLVSTTNLSASGINASEIAKCMVAKSPYSGSFPRWEYAEYCNERVLTSTERMEIQCMINELTNTNYGMDTHAGLSCECLPLDYYGRGIYDDLLERQC